MRSFPSRALRYALALLPIAGLCVAHEARGDAAHDPASLTPAPAHPLYAQAEPAYADSEQAYAAPEPVDVETFYDPLTPYGEWIDVGAWGRVWRPYASVVGPDFYPYRNRGHWVWTDLGWAFQSDYEWGWAPFHYGRWAWDPGYGWIWAPGTTWSPAWVDWRYGGGYVGWVPLGPVGYIYPERHWVFVETVHFASPTFHAYVVPPERVHTIIVVSTPISHSGSYHPSRPVGPPRVEVERAYGHPITPVRASGGHAPMGVLPTHAIPPNVHPIRTQRSGEARSGEALRGGHPGEAVRPNEPDRRPNEPSQMHPGERPGEVVRPNEPARRPSEPSQTHPGERPGEVVRPNEPARRPSEPSQMHPGERPGEVVRPNEPARRPNEPSQMHPGERPGEAVRPNEPARRPNEPSQMHPGERPGHPGSMGSAREPPPGRPDERAARPAAAQPAEHRPAASPPPPAKKKNEKKR